MASETVKVLYAEENVNDGYSRPMKGDMNGYLREKGWVNSFYSGIGAFILWFAVLTVIIWIIIFSLRPSWVLQTGNPSQVDTGKVLLASLIIALVIIIIIWIIKLLFMGCAWGY